MQRLHFLGTGNAFNSDGRFSTAIQVHPTHTSPFLVDVGPTILTAMAKSKVDPDIHDKVFITHLHGDHIAGWPFLLLSLVYLSGRTRPLDVYGPQGTREHLENLTRYCYGEIFGGDGESFEVRYHELPVEEKLNCSAGEGLRFDVFPMDHIPSSIGYCFHSESQSLGVSGDTRWCPNVEKLAERSHVLALECTCLEPQTYAHISLEEIRRQRERLAASRIVLVHLEDSIATALAEDPIDGVVAAADGWTLELPPEH